MLSSHFDGTKSNQFSFIQKCASGKSLVKIHHGIQQIWSSSVYFGSTKQDNVRKYRTEQ